MHIYVQFAVYFVVCLLVCCIPRGSYGYMKISISNLKIVLFNRFVKERLLKVHTRKTINYYYTDDNT